MLRTKDSTNDSLNLAEKSKVFLDAANTLNKIENRTYKSYEPAYYLLSHAIELSMKYVLKQHNGENVKKIHSIKKLAKEITLFHAFSESELTTIETFEQLNHGPGGLRYDNEPKNQFLPSTFNNGVKIVKQLLKTHSKNGG